MSYSSNYLGEDKISKLIIRLSIPATIGMIINALYNVVDTIFIGRGVNSLAIGALAICFPIQMILSSLAQMVGIGSASIISRSLGEKNKSYADEIAGNSIILILMINILFSTIGLIFLDPILSLFGSTTEILPYAQDYMKIIFLGNIYYGLVVSYNNIIRSEGKAKTSMALVMIGTGLNVILDPIFIFGFKMGIQGAAIATILSQFITLIFVLNYIVRGNSSLNIKFENLKLNVKNSKEIMKIGVPSFVRQVGGSVLAIVVNNSLKFYGGNIAISAFGIANRVLMFIFMPMFGIVQSLQPIVGFNYGAKKYDRVKEATLLSIKTIIVLSSIGWLIIQLFSPYIIRIFTPDIQVIPTGILIIKTITFAIPVVGIQIIGTTIFQALGKSKPAMILSLLRQFIMLIPMILILPLLMDNGVFGIAVSYPISDVISTVISLFLIRHEFREMDKIMA
ncbi:MAG: MATE family efflux transporter [Firmicutes bacterium]|jgi:putative MATE family efflux protein|nr:MATE family efflux transporter [Bacillota bacterium]